MEMLRRGLFVLWICVLRLCVCEPQICICVLSFNRLDLLRQTLVGVLEHLQSDEPSVSYELIWVDNGSNDKNELQKIRNDFKFDKVELLDYNSGIAHALNTMFFDLCSAPFILSLEEDWLWEAPKLANANDPYRSAIQIAMQVLLSDPQVVTVILRQENEHWFTRTLKSEPQLVSVRHQQISYRRHCQNLAAGHVWGAYTNGASLMHRKKLQSVGRMFGEFTKNVQGDEAKHQGSKLLEKSLGFPRGYTEANYALRVGLKYCSAVLQLVEACAHDGVVDAICNGVFVHIGDGRSHGVDAPNSVTDKTKPHEWWLTLGSPLHKKVSQQLKTEL